MLTLGRVAEGKEVAEEEEDDDDEESEPEERVVGAERCEEEEEDAFGWCAQDTFASIAG
jgi:hypothetical protein